MATGRTAYRTVAPVRDAWSVGQSQEDLTKHIAQQSHQVRQVSAQIKSLGKPDPKNKAAMAAYNARLGQLNAELKVANQHLSSLNSQQNNLYVKTGQYDKLLSGQNRDAFLAVESLFKSYGLQSLAGKIYGYVKNGYSPDTVSLLLQDSPEYKQRFSGNEARVKAGLPVLSPAQYLSTEESYRQIMTQAGLPSGFYDKPADFADLIGRDVSPSEIQSRVDLATQATTLASPAYKQALNELGIGDTHLTAYFLDPDKALPSIQKTAATAAIGAAAIQQGLAFDQSYSAELATSGISSAQAQQGYQQIAAEVGTLKALGGYYGEDWSQRQSEAGTFGTAGSQEAQAKKSRLLSQERGAFSGSAGAARGAGGLSQTRGAQ